MLDLAACRAESLFTGEAAGGTALAGPGGDAAPLLNLLWLPRPRERRGSPPGA